MPALAATCQSTPALHPPPSTWRRVYACDFAPSAIELLRAHPAYASGRVTAFVADITGGRAGAGQAGQHAEPLCETAAAAALAHCSLVLNKAALRHHHHQTADDLTAHVPPACVDVCTMIFVLSAIPPNGPSQRAALRRVAATLRPGARLLFRCGGRRAGGGGRGVGARSDSCSLLPPLCRDYAEGDLAQERLRGEGRQARTAPNTFVRWDGTLCEYFTEVRPVGGWAGGWVPPRGMGAPQQVAPMPPSRWVYDSKSKQPQCAWPVAGADRPPRPPPSLAHTPVRPALQAGLRTLFASEGFRCDSIAAQQRTVANVRQGSSWERRFVQATFTFVGGQQPDGGSAGGSEQGGGATAPQVQQQQQQLAEPAAEVAAEQLLLRLPGSPTELRLACRPAAAGAAARAAAEALAALVLACPAFFSAAAVLELCGWDAPLGALAALRWCRRAVAAGASEAQVHLLRLNVRRNGHLFIYERLRLQHLAWAQPQGQAEQAQAEQARREQQAALLRAVPGGFDAVLATVPCTAAGSLQELLAGAAQLLARRPCSLLLLCAADPAAVEQVGEAAAAAGLRAAQLPPELETAAAALQGVRILALQHA